MQLSELLTMWSSNLPLSLIIWFCITIVALYFAKGPVHGAIKTFFIVMHESLEKVAISLTATSERIIDRNKEVLFYSGVEECENQLEREFYRVNSVVESDLSDLPGLKRTLLEQISRIEQDYKQSSDIPPAPPEWLNTVESIALISKDSGRKRVVSNMLKEINRSTSTVFKTTMDEYRKTVSDNHKELNKLKPFWEKLTKTLEVVGSTVTGIQERSSAIDRKMKEYGDIITKSETAMKALTSTSLTQLVVSGLVLAIAIAGALINFKLIALPMSEMVGGGSYIGNFRTADVAAMVIILVEAAMGLFLMESLGFTRLFPVINQLDSKMKRKMLWTSLTLLIILAGIEASLALMRDQIALNNQSLIQTLAGDTAVKVKADHSLIPTAGQMILGFILPFILTFVAIPLESFLHSLRTFSGIMAFFFLKFLAYILSIVSTIFKNIGDFLTSLYDAIVFPAILIEKIFKGMKK